MDIDVTPVYTPAPPRSQGFSQFDGDKGIYRIWKRQMSAMLLLHGYADMTRVVVAIAAGELGRLAEKVGSTVAEVWKVLDGHFEDPIFRARASERLENLEQGNKTQDRYIFEYRDQLQQAGGDSYPKDVKIRGLMRGLNDALYERMVTIPMSLTLTSQIESLRGVS
ncbi:hypothetical protein Cpir12675_006696 [Ceratocystis pirilliformis]|uniref:Retrotransposon gag domain-containing protein n=1 Tax=Ceratocystis pirilliformis TaxID=259994 RepID=A0ABR3YFM4_9PEZI